MLEFKSMPKFEAISANPSLNPNPPPDISGARITLAVYCLGVFSATTTPKSAPIMIDNISHFGFLIILFAIPIISISLFLSIVYLLFYVNKTLPLHSYFKSLFRKPIDFAGTPATIVNGGISFVTTAPAQTTAPFPIVIPCNIVLPIPIQT